MNTDLNNTNDYELDGWRDLPVFKQGEIILSLVEYIVEYIELTDTASQEQVAMVNTKHHLQGMMESALIIPLKIAEAHNADVYDVKMESATLIRKAARDILTDVNGILRAHFKEVEYLELLREAIEKLRYLFIKWVATFNPNESIIDTWGLFNPPEVNLTHLLEDVIALNYNSFQTDQDDDYDESIDDDELS